MTRLALPLLLLCTATPLLALQGIALSALLAAPLSNALAAAVLAASLILLRLALEAAITADPGAPGGALLWILSLLGMAATATLLAPGLSVATLLPVLDLAPVLCLAVTLEIATRGATRLAMQWFVPRVRHELLFDQLLLRREAETTAALVAEGLKDELILRRARNELERVLNRIEDRFGETALRANPGHAGRCVQNP
jgi:hypothetical protein